MKLYFEYVHPHLKKFIPIKISKTVYRDSQNKCVEILNLKDMNQLRDKFEGISFFNNMFKGIFGLAVLEKFLNISLLDNKNIVTNKTFNLNQVGLNIDVVTFDFGELPKINLTTLNSTIFILKNDNHSGWICGFISNSDISNPENYKEIKESVYNNDYAYFTNFSILKQFSSENDLKNFLN